MSVSNRAPHSPSKLIHIQYLRGIAAMMVVLHHVVHERAGFFSPLSHTDFAKPGVLIFFVISGFVMLHACKDEPPIVFALRRIVRVVPLYWIMTMIFFLILLRSDWAKGVPLQRFQDLLPSLFFIPHYHLAVSDKIWPILVPGWTLNYEMFFFAIFLVGIISGHIRTTVFIILTLLLLAGVFFSSDNPVFITWTNSFLLLFLAGMVLAIIWSKFDFSNYIIMLPIGLIMIVLSAMKLLSDGLIEPIIYAASVLTVAGTLALQARWPNYHNRILSALGNASYSIYLSHTILLIVLLKLLAQLPLEGWLQFIITGTIAMVVCAIAGLFVYRWIEKPLLVKMRPRSIPK